MPDSGSEIEVALLTPERGARRTRRELYEQLRSAVRSGRLAPGLRMPASRALARRLGVSRNTVTTVYDLLISEGCLSARTGSGTFVAPGSTPGARRAPAIDMTDRLRPIWSSLPRPVVPPLAPRHFLMGLPDLASFPWETWRKMLNRTLRVHGPEVGLNLDPQGSPALRQAIASHLSLARGVACRPEDIVVTSGAQQAFDLLAKVLVHRPGVVLAVEDPGYRPAHLPFVAAGAKIEAAPVDDEGIVVEALSDDAEIIYVTPSHQLPLGVPMSPLRREALLAHARATGAIVIEDDYDGEFRFDGRPLEALQTLDVSQQVIYVGTFSKSLYPDLRLGFVAAPEWLRARLVSAKIASDGRTPLLAQDTLAAFIAEGHLARHVRRMRRIYGERRQALLDGVREAPDGWLGPFPSAAGLHLALRLPEDVDARAFLHIAAGLGVGAFPLSQFKVDRGGQNGLALGFGALDKADVRLGALALAEAARRAAAEL
jgi:GntR family transcriptional regulator/MocR family aminotransferase